MENKINEKDEHMYVMVYKYFCPNLGIYVFYSSKCTTYVKYV